MLRVMAEPRSEVWAIGDAYEPYVGRWSRLIARELVAWLGVSTRSRWLDVGCGTGALTQAILDGVDPSGVTGVDSSEGFLAAARRRITSAAARFELGDACALPVASACVDAAVSGLVLNFIAKPIDAVREMVRATRSGGCVAVYVWDYAGDMQLMRRFWDAAIAVDPDAVELDEGRRFPICHERPLGELFESAGLVNVAVRPIVVPTVFRTFEDYWAPFLGGQGPAPSYCMALAPDVRGRLREQLRTTLPTGTDGSIALVARAWAARGMVA
jgi:SAM-dependent methyltransferase